jgi:hypothetical protein
MTPPTAELLAQQQQQQQPRPSLSMTQQSHGIPMTAPGPGITPAIPMTSGPGSNRTLSTGGTTSSFYPSPFQNHIDQLEQEYEAQADMVDEPLSDGSNGPGPYPNQQFPQDQVMGQAPPIPVSGLSGDGEGVVFPTANQMFDPYDPSLDADPFGLSASMHFPTPFTFETSSMR